jgi:hypothetical protein
MKITCCWEEEADRSNSSRENMARSICHGDNFWGFQLSYNVKIDVTYSSVVCVFIILFWYSGASSVLLAVIDARHDSHEMKRLIETRWKL